MSDRPDNFRRSGTICAVLFFGTVLLFFRAWQHDFVNYDDPDYVTANAHVKAGLTAAGVRWALTAAGVRWALTAGEASNWHPLTWVSHLADWSLFGDNPHGHHATSVLLHAVNAVLAFAAIYRLSGALWASAVWAALFAWHPLRVESVAWISERKDVLSGLFWFLVLWAYAIYVKRRRAGARGAAGFFTLALIAFAFGLMAKPMLVTLPCVLLLLDYWPLRRLNAASSPVADQRQRTGAKGPGSSAPVALPAVTPWQLLWEKAPFFALAVASSVVTFVVQNRGGSVSMALGIGARVANAAVAVVRYLGNLVWPFDLAVLYPHPGSWPIRKVVASAVIVVALTLIVWVQRRRRPWLAVGWLWFLGALVPVIGIVQVGIQSMADRYTYLPMLGLHLALVWTVAEACTTPAAQRAWGAVAAVVLAACAARTWSQLGGWKDSFTLFDHAIAVTEKNYLAYNNRGIFLFHAGRVDEAIADYRRSLAINPDYADANNNLGHALAQQGHPRDAVGFYRAALQAKPGLIEAHNNLGNALSDLGEIDEAIQHYEFVLARQPDHVNALNGYGIVLAMKGRLPEAVARFEAALRIEPDNAGAHSNLGNACAMLGRSEEAVAHYRRAIALRPADAQAFYNLGNVLSGQKKLPAAAENYRRAIELMPNNPEAYAALGFALAQLGQREEAIRHLRTALQQRPDFPQAQAWLQAVSAAAMGK